MSCIDVDKMEAEQLSQVKMQKEKESNEKKLKSKVAIKIKKQGVRKIPVNAQNKANVKVEPPEYRPVEWAKTAMNFGFTALSIPGGVDRKEFEQKLRQSQDMQQMMANMPLSYIYENAPTEILYGLSYLSILAETKLNSGHKMVQNIRPQTVNENVVDDVDSEDMFTKVDKK